MLMLPGYGNVPGFEFVIECALYVCVCVCAPVTYWSSGEYENMAFALVLFLMGRCLLGWRPFSSIEVF